MYFVYPSNFCFVSMNIQRVTPKMSTETEENLQKMNASLSSDLNKKFHMSMKFN
jgi:hypothetical protein